MPAKSKKSWRFDSVDHAFLRTKYMSTSTPGSLPGHIAIVMDGNGRWAKKRFLPRLAGHKRGVSTLKRLIQTCLDRQIGALSVFAFSSENWSRPEQEVSGIFDLLVLSLQGELPDLIANGIRLHFVGDRRGLSEKVQSVLADAERGSAGNTRMILNVCLNYGGRWDIAQAAEGLAQRGEAITEAALDKALALSHVPDPDLLIRTGGELRVSNFLLWQMAYSELYFTDALWPEFDEAELDKALAFFAGRERRFGKTPEQVAGSAAVQVTASTPAASARKAA